MSNKKPFTEPVLGDAVELVNRNANFPLMPLMGGGSVAPGDGATPGLGVDGSMDTLGGDGVTPGNGGGDGV